MTAALDPHAEPQALNDPDPIVGVELEASTTDVGFCWALAGCSAAPCDLAVAPLLPSRDERAAARRRGAEVRDRKGRGRAGPLAPEG